MSRALGEAWAHLSHVPLRASASDRSECVNEVLAGETVIELILGDKDWVKVRLPDGYEGWMDRRQLKPVTTLWQGMPIRLSTASFWVGVAGGWLPAGAVVRKHHDSWFLGEQQIETSDKPPAPYKGDMWDWCNTMLGVPYHWGGRCSWGLDCSGMTALAAALTGKVVPRDASHQFDCGLDIPTDQIRKDDVAFFGDDPKRPTHVGICNGEGQVVHASGEVRIDDLIGHHLIRQDNQVTSHKLIGIRRWS